MATSTSIDRITVPLAAIVGLIAGTWAFSRDIVTTEDLKKAIELERATTLVALSPLIDAKVARLDSAIVTLTERASELSERVATLQASLR